MAYSQRSLCHHPSAFRKSISLGLFTIDHFTKSPYPDEEFLHLAFLVFVECTAGLRERVAGEVWGESEGQRPDENHTLLTSIIYNSKPGLLLQVVIYANLVGV